MPEHVPTHPNDCPWSSRRNGVEDQSSVFLWTVLPHQFWRELAPMVPFAGYCKLRGEERRQFGGGVSFAGGYAPEVNGNNPQCRASIEGRG